MDNKNTTKISKYLSYILRHQPQSIGLTLDKNGWANIDELITKTTDFSLRLSTIQYVVETNDKQRFSLNENATKIRANQGHSLEIDLALTAQQPPAVLYHGTAKHFVVSIQEHGLKKQNRHHVHLSQHKDVANSVGARHGKPIIFKLRTAAMIQDGFIFYQSDNNVWLTDLVPAKYLQLVEEEQNGHL